MVSTEAQHSGAKAGILERVPWLTQAQTQLRTAGASEQDLDAGTEIVELGLTLGLDRAALLAGLTYRSVRSGRVDVYHVQDLFGEDAARLVRAVLKTATTSLLEMTPSAMQMSQAEQIGNVRAMFVAMIDDVRVAILKLAERVIALRHAKHADAMRQQRIARETELIFAPLARRLGIRRLKWELEDLSLRYLHPEVYHDIAGQLDGRRLEREARVGALAQDLEAQLRAAGLQASVSGRAKNIYSIWRKMRSKNLSLTQVYDVSAVRVLVPDIAQCYAALGLIHTHWTHIPSEFDDYVAAPKDNGYRSIHTAVTDADGFTLEVQIRTQQMHREAELGVCAHWSYKDGDESEPKEYADKMNWLRRALDIQEASGWSQDLGVVLTESIAEERIFVYTPQGHVIDLAVGATPLDFAYRVHTEIGHHAIGARVDGRPHALNRALHSGQRVEIVTAPDASVRRRWLEPHLGFVTTSRAREKIQAQLQRRSDDELRRSGQRLLQRVVSRLNWPAPSTAQLEELRRALCLQNTQVDFYVELGLGAVSALTLVDALLQLPSYTPTEGAESVRLTISARDREGLLRDVALLLAERGVLIHSSASHAEPERSSATIHVDIDTCAPHDLLIITDLLAELPDVWDCRRELH